jgi:cytochrome c-type biogenesis protein CcmH/NrfG
MTEQEYHDAITKLVPDEGEFPIEGINLIDAAVQEHPGSASLWQKRAHLIQLGPEETPHPLEEALVSYHRALELDPENPDIVEDIAHFHDAVMDDEPEAQKWFAKAKELKDNN